MPLVEPVESVESEEPVVVVSPDVESLESPEVESDVEFEVESDVVDVDSAVSAEDVADGSKISPSSVEEEIEEEEPVSSAADGVAVTVTVTVVGVHAVSESEPLESLVSVPLEPPEALASVLELVSDEPESPELESSAAPSSGVHSP